VNLPFPFKTYRCKTGRKLVKVNSYIYCMNKIFYLFIIFFALSSNTFSQLMMKEELPYKKNSSTDAGNTIILGSILLISPTVILEGGKAYFGLSKELSLGKFPYGRAELDYTYIFRSERNSAVHLSYNFDIPFNGSFRQPSLFMFSPGGGYYTDFTRKGYFAQLAFGLWAGVGFADGLSIHPSVKFRKTFMKDEFPDVFDISLGVGFGFYTR